MFVGYNILSALHCSRCLIVYFSDGLCCKLGTEFAAYYEAVKQHKDDKDRCVSCDDYNIT